MAIRNLLLVSTRSANPPTRALSQPGDVPKTADFLTVQSLTYSGSLLTVGIIWAFAQKQFGAGWATSPIVPILLASLLMLASYLYAFDDLGDTSKRLAALIIAAINATLLVAGAFGITTALV